MCWPFKHATTIRSFVKIDEFTNGRAAATGIHKYHPVPRCTLAVARRL
jgi:hypothetical protein